MRRDSDGRLGGWGIELTDFRMSQNQQAQPQTPPTLEYQRRPKFAWLSRHWRTLAWLSISFAIAVSWYLWHIPLKQRAIWIYRTRQAAAHQMPTTSVPVVIRDATAARNAVSMDGDFVLDVANDSATLGLYLPQVYRNLLTLDPKIAGTRYLERRTVVFLGKVRRPDGMDRLVIMTNDSMIALNTPIDGVNVTVMPIPGPFDSVPPIAVRSVGPRYRLASMQGTFFQFDVHSGRLDPADPTHILFDVQVAPFAGRRPATTAPLASGTSVMHAYLQNNDTLRFMLPDSRALLRGILTESRESGLRIESAPAPRPAPRPAATRRVGQ